METTKKAMPAAIRIVSNIVVRILRFTRGGGEWVSSPYKFHMSFAISSPAGRAQAQSAVQTEFPFQAFAIRYRPPRSGGSEVDSAISSNQRGHPQNRKQRENSNDKNRDDHVGLHNSAVLNIARRPYKFESS
jgi:hypothetical protein